MTSSRFLTGLLVIAVAPLALASGPVEAQVSNYADGAVTIDMGALPGGGGTPLAAALGAALTLARQSQAHGLSPTLALLTDARANITLDGRGDRAEATKDTTAMARLWRAQNLPAIVIDISARPGPEPAQLAAEMNARHLPLPRADARRISTAVTLALGG